MRMSNMDEATYNIVANMIMAGFNLVNREGVLYSDEQPRFIKRADLLLMYVSKPAFIKVSFDNKYIYTDIYIEDECISSKDLIADNTVFVTDPSGDNAKSMDICKSVNSFFTAIAQSRVQDYAYALRLEAFLDWHAHFSTTGNIENESLKLDK